MSAVQSKGLFNKWIYYASQRALVSTIAILPSMDLRQVNIQYAQKVMYNLIQYNLDYMVLKKHNKEKDQSLLGSHFKIQLAQCTDQESIHALVDQEKVYDGSDIYIYLIGLFIPTKRSNKSHI